jgi:hypothetical protein
MGSSAFGVLVVAPVAVLGVLTRPDVAGALIVVGSLIAGSVASIASGRDAPADSRHRGGTPGSGKARSLGDDPRWAEGPTRRGSRPSFTATASAVVVGSGAVAGFVVIAGSATAPITVVLALIVAVVSWMGMHGGDVAAVGPDDYWPYPLPRLADVPVSRLRRLAPRGPVRNTKHVGRRDT